jgi:hypothetical protein
MASKGPDNSKLPLLPMDKAMIYPAACTESGAQTPRRMSGEALSRRSGRHRPFTVEEPNDSGFNLTVTYRCGYQAGQSADTRRGDGNAEA